MVNGTGVHISPICIEYVIRHVESPSVAAHHPLPSFCGLPAGVQIQKSDV
jgi:hypothetical protein